MIRQPGQIRAREALRLRPLLAILRREETGSGLVEFALSTSLLLTVLLGIVGLSLAAYADHFVALAAQAAVRYAAVRGSTWSGACASASATSCVATTGSVQSYVQSLTPNGVSYNNISVQTTWPGTTPAGNACFAVSGNNSPGCMVMVKVNYTFSFLLPFLPTSAIALSSTGALAVAQ